MIVIASLVVKISDIFKIAESLSLDKKNKQLNQLNK